MKKHETLSAAERTALLERLDRALDQVDTLIDLDEDRFLETHEIYEARSEQRSRIIEWFGRFVARGPRERALGVLSVGCGSGVLDVPVARRLAERFGMLTYVGVNPNAVECRKFEAAFETAAMPRVDASVVNATFEAYRTSDRFDLVHFAHSLYYLEDLEEALHKARRLLKPGGRIVVFQAPRGVLNDLAVRFYDKRYARPTLLADGFAGLLDGWGWPFAHHRIEAAVDVTPIIDGNPGLGVALRDFIIQVDGGQLPGDVQSIVGQYLKAAAYRVDGRAFIAHPVDVFDIRTAAG